MDPATRISRALGLRDYLTHLEQGGHPHVVCPHASRTQCVNEFFFTAER